MEHVRAIAQRPRPGGSAEHARVRQYLIDTLGSIGLETQVQEATGVGTHNAVAGRVFNVVARVAGTSGGGPAVLLAAHYDGVPAGPAAGDDAAGVAALLETLRALGSSPPMAHDVIALFSDGEEAGLTGAAAFTREHGWAGNVAMILNFEGRGTGGPSMMFETGAQNLDAVRVLQRVPAAIATSLTVTVYRNLPNDTDVSELVALGQPALNFGFADGLERYHTERDDIAHLDAGSVQHHGTQALALVRAFAEGPLPRQRAGDAVFFTVPWVGLFVYPEWLALPLALGTATVVLVAVLSVRRREPRSIRGIGIGIGGIIVSTAVAMALAFAVIRLIDTAVGSPSMGGSASGRGFYAAGIAMLALASATAAWALVRRWASVTSLWVGALVVWTGVALTVTSRLPGASYLFVWPLLFAAVAAVLASATDSAGLRFLADWVATLAAASLIVPTVYTVAVVILGMADPGAIIVALFVSMSAWLLACHLEILGATDRRFLPAAFISALVLIGTGAAIGRSSAANPEPSMLGYAFDVDTSRAWFVALPDFARHGSWAAEALGSSARMVTPRAVTGSDQPPEWLTRAIAGESRTLAAAAPYAPVGVPEVIVTNDARLTATRRLELRIRPAPGTYSIRFFAIDTPVLSAVVDGRAIDQTRYRAGSKQWTLGYVVPPVDGFALSLVLASDQPAEFEVIARSLGLPQDPRITIPPRPENVIRIHSGDQTIVHRRIRL